MGVAQESQAGRILLSSNGSETMFTPRTSRFLLFTCLVARFSAVPAALVTVLSFDAVLNAQATQFMELGKMKLPGFKYTTYDIAFGDVDGDNDPDIVLGNQGQNRIYLNDGRGKFTDFTASKMPKDGDRTYGLALGDVDNDRDLDLICANDQGQNKLYFNDGTGKFTDATASRIPNSRGPTFEMDLGDIDRDGDLDLVFAVAGTANQLLLNDGKGKFTEVTTTQIPNTAGWTEDLTFGDVDGDGDLDLVCGNRSQNSLFLNDGKGNFTDVTASQMPKNLGWTNKVALADVDGDKDLDLVSATVRGTVLQNSLFLNNGKGSFSDLTASLMPKDMAITTDITTGDVDGDGDLDLIFGNHNGQNVLYMNNGQGKFTDMTARRMPKDTDPTGAVTLGDVDGDGDPDLILGNEGQSRLYLNLHRHVYSQFSAQIGKPFLLYYFAKPGYATGIQYAMPFVNLQAAVPPIKIQPFGSLGLYPVGIAPLPLKTISGPTGFGSFQVTFPSDPNLIGNTLYIQALIVHHLTPLHAHVTNVMADPILK